MRKSAVRTKAIENLNSAVALFGLDAASENIFAGDAGDTQPTLLPTRRIGIEWTNDYHPVSWIDLDADVAGTRARFLGYDTAQQATYVSLWGYPQASIGNAPGNYVPGAATIVGSINLTIGEKTGWFGGLGYRYFGPRPLTEDNAFRSPATGLLNARVGYRIRQRLDAPAGRPQHHEQQVGPDHLCLRLSFADGCALLAMQRAGFHGAGRCLPKWRHGPRFQTGRAIGGAINARWQVLITGWFHSPSSGMPDVDMRMFLCTIIAVGVRFLLDFNRDGHEAAMPHSPLGDDMFGEMMNFAGCSAQ